MQLLAVALKPSSPEHIAQKIDVKKKKMKTPYVLKDQVSFLEVDFKIISEFSYHPTYFPTSRLLYLKLRLEMTDWGDILDNIMIPDEIRLLNISPQE